jgi:predicted regulator of Ras-like GTPase activity (Roadblock/LC7/MglB family)
MTKTFRNGLVLSDEQIRQISLNLSELGDRIPARYLLVVESTGQFVTEWGDRRDSDPVSLGALMAGDVLATLEMARQTGEDSAYQMILREGRQETAFLTPVDRHLIILALVSRNVPIGWARLLLYYTAEHLARLVEWQETEPLPELDLSQENLCELFGEELDSLWLSGGE